MRHPMAYAFILGIAAVIVAILFAEPQMSTFLTEWGRYAQNEAVKAHDLRYVGGGPVLLIAPPDWRLLVALFLDAALVAAAMLAALQARQSRLAER